MRDRLIKILEKADSTVISFSIAGDIEVVADTLLAEGVIVPPCKKGQTVFYPFRRYWCDGEYKPFEDTVEKIIMQQFVNNGNFAFECSTGFTFRDTAIGKTVFLTRDEADKAFEEAEKKLAKRSMK